MDLNLSFALKRNKYIQQYTFTHVDQESSVFPVVSYMHRRCQN